MFNVGDRVVVTTTRWDDKNFRYLPIRQSGLEGTISRLLTDDPEFQYEVEFLGFRVQHLMYAAGEIELASPKPIMEPEVSLDEIHQFQDLVDGA